MFGGLFGELFGGEAAAEGVMGISEMLSPDGRRDAGTAVVYERYLCGKPRELNINDR